MARAPEYCANCGQRKTGGHFTRQIGGKTQYFCKGTSLKQAQAAGLAPSGNQFRSAGTSPPQSSSGTATQAQQPASTTTPPVKPQQAKAPAAPSQQPATPTPSKPQQTAAPQSDQAKAALEQWLSRHSVSADEYEISNNRLNIKKDFVLSDATIPVPLGQIDGDFKMNNPEVSSMENAPTVVKGDFECSDTKLASLEGLNVEVHGNVDLTGNTQLKQLTDIHHHFKKIGGGEMWIDLGQDPENERGGMGMVLIKGLTSVALVEGAVEELFNKCLEGEIDLFDLQEELIDGGFSQYARVAKKPKK